MCDTFQSKATKMPNAWVLTSRSLLPFGYPYRVKFIYFFPSQLCTCNFSFITIVTEQNANKAVKKNKKKNVWH